MFSVVFVIQEVPCENMSPILYHHALSPSSRTALLTIRNVDLDEYEVKNIDINVGEQNAADYLKINQVPVYVDDDFILTESRAIACYLANSVQKFYPTDLKERALVDSRLYFDASNTSIKDFVVRKLLFCITLSDNWITKSFQYFAVV